MKVVVIGGTGTIGSEVVKRLSERHEVVCACRTNQAATVDIQSTDALRRFFQSTGPVDAVVCTAGEAVFKPLADMTDEDFALGLGYKLMGQVNLVRVATDYVRDGGSFSLTSGATARQPIPGVAGYALVNSAIEGFARAAALDLPRAIRINAVSPNWTVETLRLYGMDPSWGVPAAQVALGYVESVEGDLTGTVIDAGWQWDPSSVSATVAAPVATAA